MMVFESLNTGSMVGAFPYKLSILSIELYPVCIPVVYGCTISWSGAFLNWMIISPGTHCISPTVLLCVSFVSG